MFHVSIRPYMLGVDHFNSNGLTIPTVHFSDTLIRSFIIEIGSRTLDRQPAFVYEDTQQLEISVRNVKIMTV